MSASLETAKRRFLPPVVLIILGIIAAWAAHGQWTVWRAGGWERRIERLEAPRSERYAEVVGAAWPWIERIRRDTPEHAAIGLHVPDPPPPDLAGILLQARFLCYPRRVRLVGDMRRWLEKDPNRLNDLVWGVTLTLDQEPEYAELWRERARGESWRLLQWNGKPR